MVKKEDEELFKLNMLDLSKVIIILLWMATTMATITAINSLLTVWLHKALVFMGSGLVSSILYYKMMR